MKTFKVIDDGETLWINEWPVSFESRATFEAILPKKEVTLSELLFSIRDNGAIARRILATGWPRDFDPIPISDDVMQGHSFELTEIMNHCFDIRKTAEHNYLGAEHLLVVALRKWKESQIALPPDLEKISMLLTHFNLEI